MASEKRTVQGGCHCGFIRYTFDAELDPQTGGFNANRCNCTFCQKTGTTNLHLKDPASFKLLSPDSKDPSEKLGIYAPRVKSVGRYFCKDCGVHVWMGGYWEQGEGESYQRHDLSVVNLNTVDQPQEGIDLALTKIKYFDMLHNNYTGGLKDTPWPNGLV